MDYTFKSNITPFDLWRLSKRRTYRSVIGVCNIVFTVAIIILTGKFFYQANDILQVLMFLGCILFPVLQPFAVYLKAKGQAAVIPRDMELHFDERGLHVAVGQQRETIPWSKMRGIVREYKMLILFSDARHGYMLSDRMLGREKESFYQAVKEKIGQSQ